MGILNRLMHGWNAFFDNEKTTEPYFRGGGYSGSWGVRPDRPRRTFSSERSIISSIYTRLAIDSAAIRIRHIMTDENERFVSVVKDGLHRCLNVEANLDQTASAFRLDLFMTLFDKGVIALVPIDVNIDPTMSNGYDIETMRVGEVIQWYPQHVEVRVYNEQTGQTEDIRLPKKIVAIVENPLYSVMNEPNSTLQRLIRKLNLLDAVDEASSSGKMDLIIQLPFPVRTESRQQAAEKRRADIEMQLKGSKHGIAYLDGTEKITQLNRPVENNMLKQIEYLTNMLYSQLGLTPAIFDGTADEAAMLNYYNRTVEPLLRAVTEAIERTFISRNARTRGHAINFSRDPFRLVPLANLAELADKFTRNEILTSNEFRGLLGFKPIEDGKSDQLINSNVPQPALTEGVVAEEVEDDGEDVDQLFNEMLDGLEANLDKVLSEEE